MGATTERGLRRAILLTPRHLPVRQDGRDELLRGTLGVVRNMLRPLAVLVLAESGHPINLYAMCYLDHLDRSVEVGAGAVHLVHEAHPRHAVLVRLSSPTKTGCKQAHAHVFGE